MKSGRRVSTLCSGLFQFRLQSEMLLILQQSKFEYLYIMHRHMFLFFLQHSFENHFAFFKVSVHELLTICCKCLTCGTILIISSGLICHLVKKVINTSILVLL